MHNTTSCRIQPTRWIAPPPWQHPTTKSPSPPSSHPLIEAILQLRGISPEQQSSFLNPKLASLSCPFEVPQMDLAIARIEKAIAHQENVLLFGDYDVDGVTSLALMQQTLSAWGLVNCHAFIPDRIQEGYGLSQAGIQRCTQEFQPQLFIALDCGTNSHQEIAELTNQGIDVIVIDHHQATGSLPKCTAIINPQLGENAGLKQLCTAGLTFKVAHALRKTRPPAHDSFDLKHTLDLVALATIADICPLVGENRLFVRHGIEKMLQINRPGLMALMQQSGITSKPSSSDIGFRLAPRLNAAGRLFSALTSYKLLSTNNTTTATKLAEQLQQQNSHRQQIQAEAEQEVEEQIAQLNSDPPALILASRAWHPGIAGILAGRIARRYHRPTFIIGIDENGIGKGSGRSIQDFSLVEALQACQAHLIQGGGHKAAAGITIKETEINSFRDAFLQWMQEAKLDTIQAPTLAPDLELPLQLCTSQLLEQWPQLEPFGQDFSQPLFFIRHCTSAAPPRWLKEQHLKLELQQSGTANKLNAIWFHAADHFPTFELPPPPWNLVGELSINEFRNQTSLQFLIRDLQSSTS